MSKGSVVQEWVAAACTWKMQTVMLSALRGCDGFPKEDPSKELTRIIRHLVLNNADNKEKFMQVRSVEHVVARVASDLDHYPVHWVMHTIHALEILAYKHPNVEVRHQALHAYCEMVKALHLHIESEEQLDYRLADADGIKPTRPEDIFPRTVTEIRQVNVPVEQSIRSSGTGGYRG